MPPSLGGHSFTLPYSAQGYGRGAGSLPTGSSVVSDIMEVAKNVSYNETGRLKPFYYDQKDILAKDWILVKRIDHQDRAYSIHERVRQKEKHSKEC